MSEFKKVQQRPLRSDMTEPPSEGELMYPIGKSRNGDLKY